MGVGGGGPPSYHCGRGRLRASIGVHAGLNHGRGTMAFVDEPFVKIDWDEKLQSIVADWKGIGGGEAYRWALDRSLELVRARKARRWLGIMLDASGVMSQDDTDWLVRDWFPRLLAAGGRRFAVVLPPQALA